MHWVANQFTSVVVATWSHYTLRPWWQSYYAGDVTFDVIEGYYHVQLLSCSKYPLC